MTIGDKESSRNRQGGAAFSWHLVKKEVSSMRSRVGWLQVLIVLSALAGVVALQSARRRPGVLAKV